MLSKILTVTYTLTINFSSYKDKKAPTEDLNSKRSFALQLVLSPAFQSVLISLDLSAFLKHAF